MLINFLKNIKSIFRNNPKDFDKNIEEAKDWGEKKFESWFFKKITPFQRKAFTNYVKKDDEIINKYLNLTEGELVTDKERQKELSKELYDKDIDKLNTQIDLMSNGLKLSQIGHEMHVYTRIDESALSTTTLKIFDKSENIDFAALQQLNKMIKDQNLIITNHGFLNTSLVHSKQAFPRNIQKLPILLKIHLSKDTHGAYIQSMTGGFFDALILLDKGTKIQIKSFVVNVENGKKVVAAEATIV